MKAPHDRPLAAAGLTSYRLRGRYGWIMIGATDHEHAMREAARSTTGYAPDRTKLEVWDGSEYVNAGLTSGIADSLRRDDIPGNPGHSEYSEETSAALRRAARRGTAKLSPEMVAEIDRDWVMFDGRQIAIKDQKAVRL